MKNSKYSTKSEEEYGNSSQSQRKVKTPKEINKFQPPTFHGETKSGQDA